MKRYYNYRIKKVFSVPDLKTIEELEFSRGLSSSRECHDFYECVYVLNGTVELIKNDSREILSRKYFSLISRNVQHNYYFKTDSKIYIICFTCKSSFMSSIAKTIKLNDDQYSLLERIFSEAKSSFEFPFKEKLVVKQSANFGAQQLVENLIEEFLIQLFRDHTSPLQPIKDSLELQENIVKDILLLLNENLYTDIKLSDICAKMYYSSTYLNKIFKQSKQTTIMKYYLNLKLEEAKNLIRQGISTANVAEKLCFIDSNYFSKVFKKYTGLSPFQFKKSIL